MKKIIAVILALCLTAALSACGSEESLVQDTADTPRPVAETEPAPTPFVPDPQILEELGAPVILNISNITETYPAPDDPDRVILTYGYDDVDVYLESNTAAAEAINQFLATQDEIYYSGTGNGDGINAVLELAMDNYALIQDHDAGLNMEFSCMRSAYIDRADSRVIALRYRINSYTGGAHGIYADRAYVFDTASGRVLSFDDLASDRSALEKLLLEKMYDTLHNDVRYKPIFDYMVAFKSDENLDEELTALFRDGSWTLTNEGLTVFSDIYEIGSYADGIVRFTVSYEDLAGLLKEEWLPVKRTHDGQLNIMGIDDRGGKEVHLLDKVSISEDGQEFRVYAEGTVYDVSITSVTYISDDIGFYQTQNHWYCSYLSNLGVQVQTAIPDGMPDLMISCRDESGTEHSFLLTESGEDGSVLLLEEDNVAAVG